MGAGAAGPVAPPAAQTLEFQCRSDAFCEDFESADPASRWSGASAPGAPFAFVAPSASKGARSMRVTSIASGAPVFLRKDGGAFTGALFGAVAFAIRVDATASVALGGPTLALTGAGGGEATIGVVLRAEGVALEQHATTCAAPACRERADVVAAPVSPGAWHTVVVGFEVNESPAPPYGRLEIGVDGADLTTYSLTVPFFEGALELRAGITSPDTALAGVQIDDVMFFAK
jgi:hypothetical protein